MALIAAPPRVRLRDVARAPGTTWAWRETAFVVAGVPVQCAPLAALTVPWVFLGPATATDVAVALVVPVVVVGAGERRDRGWQRVDRRPVRLAVSDGWVRGCWRAGRSADGGIFR